MRLSNVVNLCKIEILKYEITIKLAFILVLVIDVEVIKTNASFLTIQKDINLHNSLYSYNKNM